MFRLEADSCPSCNNRLNAVEPNNDDSNRPPEKGDITLCVYCESVLQFGENLKLKALSREEFNNLDQDTQFEMMRAITMIRQHKGTSAPD